MQFDTRLFLIPGRASVVARVDGGIRMWPR